MFVSTADVDAIPTRRTYDPSNGTLTVVCDVLPASIDELRVRAGADRVRVDVETTDGRRSRTAFSPPNRHIAVDEHRAVYNNGVLEITVGTERRDCAGRHRSR